MSLIDVPMFFESVSGLSWVGVLRKCLSDKPNWVNLQKVEYLLIDNLQMSFSVIQASLVDILLYLG